MQCVYTVYLLDNSAYTLIETTYLPIPIETTYLPTPHHTCQYSEHDPDGACYKHVPETQLQKPGWRND